MTLENERCRHCGEIGEPDKLPWRVDSNMIISSDGQHVGLLNSYNAQHVANGVHIVRCVNAHDGLVAACEAMLYAPREAAKAEEEAEEEAKEGHQGEIEK